MRSARRNLADLEARDQKRAKKAQLKAAEAERAAKQMQLDTLSTSASVETGTSVLDPTSDHESQVDNEEDTSKPLKSALTQSDTLILDPTNDHDLRADKEESTVHPAKERRRRPSKSKSSTPSVKVSSVLARPAENPALASEKEIPANQSTQNETNPSESVEAQKNNSHVLLLPSDPAEQSSQSMEDASKAEPDAIKNVPLRPAFLGWLLEFLKIVTSLLSLLLKQLMRWSWWLGFSLLIFYLAGCAIETMAIFATSSKDFMCQHAHPLLTIFRSTHICEEPGHIPHDPFGTDILSGFVVNIAPRLGTLPTNISSQKHQLSEVLALISANQENMFPNYGPRMEQLAIYIDERLGECAKLARDVQHSANNEMDNLALKMQQTAVVANNAVQEKFQRGKMTEVVYQLLSTAFPFLLPLTRNHQIITHFLFQIDDSVPRLEEVINSAQELQFCISGSHKDIQELSRYFHKEHSTHRDYCDSYSMFNKPTGCKQWASHYTSAVTLVDTMGQTLSSAQSLIQASSSQLGDAQSHIEVSRKDLHIAKYTLGRKRDVMTLRPIVLGLLSRARNFNQVRTLTKQGKIVVIEDNVTFKL